MTAIFTGSISSDFKEMVHLNPERTYISHSGDKKSSRLVVNILAVISDSMVNTFRVHQ